VPRTWTFVPDTPHPKKNYNHFSGVSSALWADGNIIHYTPNAFLLILSDSLFTDSPKNIGCLSEMQATSSASQWLWGSNSNFCLYRRGFKFV